MEKFITRKTNPDIKSKKTVKYINVYRWCLYK